MPNSRRVTGGLWPAGRLLKALASRHQVTGFDAAPHAFSLAQRTPALQHNIRQATSAEAMLPELAEADVVLLMDVLEHTRDDFEALSWIIAVMQPGAHLLITVPANPALWSPHDVEFEHFRRHP